MRASSSPLLRRVVLATLIIATPASGQLKRDGAAAISDTEFWSMFTTMSEPGGTFSSENFVSNEMTFQHVIPTLQRTVRPDGVYLGVGPEQNFTYIANLKPRLAIIFDIRRQNAMAHLMYKALFEMSPTRAEFVSRLFSRPVAARVSATAKVDDLFAVTSGAAPSDSAFAANRQAVFAQLVNKHRFVLTPGDSASIEHLMEVFFEAGPDVNYAYRRGRPGTNYSTYPTYGVLQARTNADSVQMAFLANEDNYRVVREMHLRNLIVPVVGDFAGPKAIRAVGDYLRKRNLTVQAFYLSNVEQYLFQNRVAPMFYENVATLPIDSTSMFIRSVPPFNNFGVGGMTLRSQTSIGSSTRTTVFSNGVISSATTFDSAGGRWLRTVHDSGGYSVAKLYRNNDSTMTLARVDSARGTTLQGQSSVRVIPMPNPAPAPAPFSPARPQTLVMSAGSLVSGIGSIQKALDAFKAGSLLSYPADIIGVSRFDGWR
jgi:hypothetical protein